jgi:hypothetical protein
MKARLDRRRRLCGVLVPLVLLIALSCPGYAQQVTLAWDANSEPDLAGYMIYYGSFVGGPYDGIGSADGPSPIVIALSDLEDPQNPAFVVSGLEDGTHYFVATAYDADGFESGFSNEVMVWIAGGSVSVGAGGGGGGCLIDSLTRSGRSVEGRR